MFSAFRCWLVVGLLAYGSVAWGLADKVVKGEADRFLSDIHQLTLSGAEAAKDIFVWMAITWSFKAKERKTILFIRYT